MKTKALCILNLLCFLYCFFNGHHELAAVNAFTGGVLAWLWINYPKGLY